ncbi:MAG: lipocalin-like domain-containing protein [Terriglobales bacterium]
MRLCALLLLWFLAPPAFQIAVPGYRWHFPQDDYAHANFASEWWYFTGNLAAADGRRFGFELTFFRFSPAPATALERQLYFAHFTITDIDGRRFEFDTRARRGNWAQAGIARDAHGFHLWSENWRADFDASGPRHLQAAWGGMRLDLALTPGARMLNGVEGWSQKGSAPGEASYYYSYPHLQAAGSVRAAAVTGLAWMDHEFGTDQLAPDQQGWDWMGLHLPAGDLMLFNLRQSDGGRDPHSAGSWRPRSGAAIPLRAADFTLKPLAWWHKYPIRWQVTVPRLQLEFTIAAALADQELRDPAIGVAYWEGAVALAGSQAGEKIQGAGYLELTGYAAKFNLLSASPRGQ